MADRIKSDQKLEFLRQIYNRREVLFSKFSAGSKDITNEMKQRAWQDVLEYSQESGLPFCATAMKQSQPWKYVRDKVYGNYVQQLKVGFTVRSCFQWNFQAKTDSWRMTRGRDRGQSGAAGVVDDVLNAPERMLLDILGRDSQVIGGINHENDDDDSNPVGQCPKFYPLMNFSDSGAAALSRS
jgi:hypothetical protein